MLSLCQKFTNLHLQSPLHLCMYGVYINKYMYLIEYIYIYVCLDMYIYNLDISELFLSAATVVKQHNVGI